ncbi:transmembrane emp24 domain-containing protein 9 isoform X2 [Molossus molossus]|uniref:Transmembrane p24 trafficking protein 9 n=1 Tax=Molossus molossus TaxID=27622 RepID=A0A7J8IEB0_MOLMO|nr:transmembrane emp24 domain-containing protein 9 isoform X2 [Molossus molossus]KAF6482419.1 transmembrane p24 trafficking protein 9 [Molossus molossus]
MAVEQCVRVVGPCPGVGMRWMVRTVLLLLWFAARGGALYFHIGETEKKCFIEEIPDETMVIGNYRTQLYDKQREEYQPATPGLGMFVEVKDPEDKVILARQYGSEGRFTFTSHTPGEHQICLHSNSTKFSLFAGGMLRVHLDIQWREERFRQTSESTNQRVLWWSILQTLILVAIGVWQMRHLKSFFEAKKLV